MLWAVMMAAILCMLLILPLALRENTLACAAIIILFSPLNIPFWSLIHEAIHRNLHPRKGINEFMGRSLAILFGASFDVLRFGHLMHHQYNREWESEIFEPPAPRHAALNHYFKMLGGLYLTEVVLSFLIALSPSKISRRLMGVFFPDERYRQAALQNLAKPGGLFKIRMDCVLMASLYICTLYLYGAQAWLLALFIACRALVISLMDNAYHYGTPPDNSVPAKELHVPPILSRMMLHFNYHMTHHKNAGLPWPHLPGEHEKQQQNFDERLLPALLLQFKGPISKTHYE